MMRRHQYGAHHRLRYRCLVGVDLRRRQKEIELSLGEDADQPTDIEDRQMSQVVLPHEPVRGRQRLRRPDGMRHRGHEIRDGQRNVPHAPG